MCTFVNIEKQQPLLLSHQLPYFPILYVQNPSPTLPLAPMQLLAAIFSWIIILYFSTSANLNSKYRFPLIAYSSGKILTIFALIAFPFRSSLSFPENATDFRIFSHFFVFTFTWKIPEIFAFSPRTSFHRCVENSSVFAKIMENPYDFRSAPNSHIAQFHYFTPFPFSPNMAASQCHRSTPANQEFRHRLHSLAEFSPIPINSLFANRFH